MTLLKLTQLHYFVSTVRAGSINSSAQNLYISQPALSKQIALLEKEFNCELFQRKTTGLALTPAGRFLFDRAVTLLSDADELSKDMERFTQRTSIKMGALPSIGSYFLPTVISKISKYYKMELTIKDTTEELVRSLNNNQIDFAFVQDAGQPKNLTVKHLFSEPYDAIIATSSYAETMRIDDLLKNNLVLLKHPCDIRQYFEDYCNEKQLSFTVSLDLESNESVIPFVKSGLGVSILPRMASRQVNDTEVKICILEGEQMQRSIDLLYKPTIKEVAKELLVYCNEAIT
jgi:DNA-binding transcriptional LysR family regulator